MGGSSDYKFHFQEHKTKNKMVIKLPYYLSLDTSGLNSDICMVSPRDTVFF